jgi:protein TonB
MQNPRHRKGLLLHSVVLSSLLHASLCVIVLVFGIKARVLIVKPLHIQTVAQVAISGGSHKITITLPASQMSSHTREPDKYADPAKKTILPMVAPPVQRSGGGSLKNPHHGNGSAQALRGNGSDNADIRPAFPVFSPHPPVHDRSLLPAAEQKIVVDVQVDELGQVVKETLVKGIGNQLDQIVLDVVKKWKFQPATVNGKPVATEAELIFPFDRNYVVADS